MDVTDEIKARLDIVSYIGQHVPLKKSGRSYKALCPFHSEKTPSFVVFPESQQWRCFGACGEGGDIFTFVMKREGWDFPEALRYLADQAGVELRPMAPQQAEAQETTERLRVLLGETAEFYHRQLLTAPGAAFARSYIEKRGLNQDTLHNFLIGYAPDTWDTTMNMLLEKGYTRDELEKGGLLVVREDERVYDRFRNRLIIPIWDARGNVVGFGARALAPEATPKYLNSPQSDIFDKSALLYGLSHARRSIRESETAVIVEGYMDVIQAHQAGFTNVVAEMGTALTEQQLRLLSRYANRLVLALDPDTAGQMATERGREVIEQVSKDGAGVVGEEGLWGLDAAEREYRTRLTPEFSARGMLHYESRMGFDIRVITLPEGKDPDDLIREDPAAWTGLVENALPIVEHAIRRATAGQNLADPKVKAEIARDILPLIEDVANPVERSHYSQRLARLLKVPETALFPAGAKKEGRKAARAPRDVPAQAQRPPDQAPPRIGESPMRSREAFCLAALIRHPRLIYQINRVLAEHLAPGAPAGALHDSQSAFSSPADDMLASQVTASDFAHPAHRSIFETWVESLSQDSIDPIQHLQGWVDPVGAELVSAWLEKPLYAVLRDVSVPAADLSYEKIFEEAVRGFLNLRDKRLEERLQELEFLLAEDDSGGSSLTVREHEDTIKALLIMRKRITRALGRYGQRGKQVGQGRKGAVAQPH
jgi:DNA primase